jgi:hypothetical protein
VRLEEEPLENSIRMHFQWKENRKAYMSPIHIILSSLCEGGGGKPEMKKGVKFWSLIVILIMFMSFCVAIASMDNSFEDSAKSPSNTSYAPDDSAQVQRAGDNATAGDTIIVRDGTYTEKGENSSNNNTVTNNAVDSNIRVHYMILTTRISKIQGSSSVSLVRCYDVTPSNNPYFRLIRSTRVPFSF